MHPLSPACVPSTHTRHFYVSIQPPVGELMAPVFMSENEFRKEQGEWRPGADGGSPTIPTVALTACFVPLPLAPWPRAPCAAG